MWMALDDVDRENGALSYIPGSHKEGVRDHTLSSVVGFSQAIPEYKEADFNSEVLVEGLKPGDVVCHHGQTIHRAGPNLSQKRRRRALALVYRGASCTRDRVLVRRYEEELRSQQGQQGV